MAPIATSASLHSIPASIRTRSVPHSSISFGCNSNLANSRLSAFGGLHVQNCNVSGSLKVEKSLQCHGSSMYQKGAGAGAGTVVAAKGDNPPIMPVVTTPDGQMDLSTVLFRNRTIYIGQFISPQVAQRVISQLLTLAAIDVHSDILLYLNCIGGSIYSTFAIYDCMKWIKPRVGTVGFGSVASQGAILLAGGEKGMRYAMPNTRVMIHQPQTGFVGDSEAVRHQMNAGLQNRHRIDMMYSAFTGQPLEKVQGYTERDRFLTAGEALDFGLVDALLDTVH
ncbi:ATP-dependent Clp protease proteolytic subunit [Rhynchospora pubera]|uniref:ATP-dependent Clp protease proteolytic subunit n=1 Tax=Rhynchospora pubera TaxID=906938 RepID=A0AAV8FLJ1_9POAL|nr:ATP-dependent Clp protease proteolytic subunit [Rhynchospora pubera]